MENYHQKENSKPKNQKLKWFYLKNARKIFQKMKTK
jgi:hypothetical protein